MNAVLNVKTLVVCADHILVSLAMTKTFEHKC